jgi:hypothetical protein
MQARVGFEQETKIFHKTMITAISHNSQCLVWFAITTEWNSLSENGNSKSHEKLLLYSSSTQKSYPKQMSKSNTLDVLCM